MSSILHIGNVAGVPQALSKAQRKLGHTSDILHLDSHPFGYKVDLYYPTKTPFPLSDIEKMLILLKISDKLKEYEIIHLHSSALPFRLYAPIWNALGKRIIVHHHGSDIRYKGERWMYSKFADKIIVSTPDLLVYSPNAVWIPNPISLDEFSYVGVEHKDESEGVNIVHAPSNRGIKGTEHILKTVDELKNEGYKINLILIENMLHAKAVKQYKKADILIDWMNPNFGIYGMVSVENMALGKPVICCIKQKFIDDHFNGLPLFNSDPSNLTEKTRLLVEDWKLRKELGEKGRRYVEQMHDADKIAEQLMNFYVD